MNFLGKLLKILKIRQALGHNRYSFGKNSATDWLIIVGVFITLSAIFAALAFYQFSSYQKNDMAVERLMTATSTVVSFNRAELDEAVRYFAERERQFNKIKITKPRFADPSK